MAWVRLDDQVPRHPKILRAGPTAAWLWVCAIAYSQSQLTDGYIPDAAIGTLGVLPLKQAKSSAGHLVTCGLFEREADGYRVHDYHDHNSTRADALARRDSISEARRESGRQGGKAKAANASKPLANTASKRLAPSPSHPLPILKEEETTPPPPTGLDTVTMTIRHPVGPTLRYAMIEPTARSKRPIFNGQRLVVHEWMLDDCMKALGTHTDAFNLHKWFTVLDGRMIAAGLLQPKRDSGAWLQSELVAEANRRGIALTVADAESVAIAASTAKGPSIRPHEVRP